MEPQERKVATLALLQQELAHLVATGFGLGRVAIAPGTWGTLQALVVWCAIEWVAGPTTYTSRAVACSLLLVVGIWAVNLSVAHPVRLTQSLLKPKDPSDIVVDEWVGLWIALIPASLANFWSLIGAFTLFRLFDVVKPWPVSYFDKREGTLGVLLDDVAAGVISAALLAIIGSYLAS